MEFTIQRHTGQWEVWLQLERGRPARMANSFIIGVGETREAAIADALTDIDEVKARILMQAKPATVDA